MHFWSKIAMKYSVKVHDLSHPYSFSRHWKWSMLRCGYNSGHKSKRVHSTPFCIKKKSLVLDTLWILEMKQKSSGSSVDISRMRIILLGTSHQVSLLFFHYFSLPSHLIFILIHTVLTDKIESFNSAWPSLSYHRRSECFITQSADRKLAYLNLLEICWWGFSRTNCDICSKISFYPF